MIRSLLATTALLLILTPTAQASTINFLLTTEHYTPTIGPPEISFSFSIFESATNGWPFDQGARTVLASGGGPLLPGVKHFTISLATASLNNVYFIGWGSYWSGPGLSQLSIYVAEPPTGPVSDMLAWGYGPPWISMANLGSGMASDFRYINGYSRGPIGTWSMTAAPPPMTSAPEPASMLLLGSGLAALAARKYRQSKTRPPSGD
ncbi:MAG TPA: PEP-CTERM sorting domain-containing protein [Vicinamibacterales bacterium]